MALASWVINWRRASKGRCAPENVKAMRRPSRPKRDPSTADIPVRAPSGSLASRRTPTLRPISMRTSIPRKSAPEKRTSNRSAYCNGGSPRRTERPGKCIFPPINRRFPMLRQLSRTAIASLLASSVAAAPMLQAQQASAPAKPAASSAPTGPSDPWPRRLQTKEGVFLIYQPQRDSWKDNQLDAHAAVSVQPQGAKDPTFGVIWFTARTDVDKTNRLVYLEDLNITRSSFPSAPDKAAAWIAALHELEPAKRSKAISLDRLEADLGIVQAKTEGESRPLQNNPPQIIFSNVPAVLVLTDGQPVYKPQTGTDLQRLINTSAIVLKADSGELYLHLFDGWVEASSIQGPWKVSDPHFGRKGNLDKALKDILAAKNGDPMTGGSASDPKAPKPSLKDKPTP